MKKNSANHRRAAIVLAFDPDKAFKSRQPRYLHALLGPSLVERSLQLCASLEARPVLVVRSTQHKNFAQLEKQGVLVVSSKQNTLRAGLSAALAKLRGIDEVVILSADQPLLEVEHIRALWHLKQQQQAPFALLSSWLAAEAVSTSLRRDDAGQLVGLKNRRSRAVAPDSDQALEIDAGLWIVDRKILQKSVKNPARGQKLLAQLIDASQGHIAQSCAAANAALHVVTRLDFALAARLLQARRNRELMLEGVGMLDPTTVWIDAGCQVEPGAFLGSNVQLRGTTRVGSGAQIDANVVVQDSVIEPGVQLRSFSHVEDAVIKSGAIVGPYSRLRPGADIGENAHIGNFVEVKKAVIEAGAKANHLAYLGDARVGAGSNIGAGTITCNYDGALKHHSDIGRNVFVGSNSTLVAPITLNDGAYVAAGSTLTQEVPEDALAFGRARQFNKAGVARRLRARNQKRKQQASQQSKKSSKKVSKKSSTQSKIPSRTQSK